MNAILIDGEGTVTKECVIGDLNVNSYKKTQAIVKLKSKIEKSAEKDCIMEFINESAVERCSFEFEDTFEASHSYIMKVKNGSMEIQKCEFYSSATAEDMKLSSSVVSVESGELRIFDSAFRDLHSTGSILLFNRESNVTLLETSISNIKSEGDVVSVGGKAKVVMKIMRIENVSVASERCVVAMEDAEQEVSVLNCSFEKSANSVEKGSMMQIRRSKEVKVEICVFDGEKEEKEAETVNEEQGRGEKLCEWSGSLIDIENSNVEMKETTVMKSKEGGLWVSGGSLMIENSKFENNNPSVEGYPSARRNVICTGNSELNVASVKGGDGLKDNSSLWILDEGCQLGGIASERTSSFFIPVLEEVKNTTQASGGMDLSIRGKLLLPCNLSLKISMKDGDVELIQTQKIEENECVSENEIHSVITSEQVEVMGKKTEVSMSILFGKGNSLSSNKLVVINKTVSPSTGDDRISEGGNKNVSNGFSINTLIIIIFAVLFIIVLIVAIVLAIRWRKSKRRTEELEEIVNDTVKKDPKAFEMVTMDMSPEDQWRKAEKDAERINNEKMKIRYGGKKMAHSESSEYLLAESGSTEYILGHDSDKIPNWALEKADEKEDDEITRKRSPSPSISSTSTNDSDSSFVRMEDMCPTTSSMSNLVDAMACSSPHEKLIVDLRDSLFMLLHGKNEKKEMAIGNLQQREMTGAQILFWVANGALHSFDEMEVPLQSLDNLSPHIVLFSEHMVITIALHSDCSSDDSDSSSISSSTLATSSSDCSSINKRNKKSPIPSSAFEEDDDSMKESLRWKAPELMMNRKMVANKKTVAFTIGMMLWECLTLQIPFGEYEAAAAGQKIVNGERPDLKRIEASSLNEAANICLQMRPEFRPKLGELKREFIKLFPAGATVLTISDAVDYETVSDNNGESVVVEVESCTTMNEM
ncbi:uncharacterized protein MONOS_16038p2 [Monocercomonoides exilis]|uniref:uncharacterized protein n=1 Tax=Monocercomonoides exilis TaxID=2049356 RepID=UPI00355945A1|nr:hypothetical protein MONOS_16038p2 [Monocercomonoides exilis]